MSNNETVPARQSWESVTHKVILGAALLVTLAWAGLIVWGVVSLIA